MALHIELFEPEPGCFTVIAGGRFAPMLGKDEALFVVATLLIGGASPRYLQTYADWHAWRVRYAPTGWVSKPVALLAGPTTSPTAKANP